MRRKQKRGQWLCLKQKTLFKPRKAELRAETDTSYGMGRSISVGSDKLPTLSCEPKAVDWQRASAKWKRRNKKLYHQIPPTPTFPHRFPLKLNRHPWDISSLKFLFKGHIGVDCGERVQKTNFSKNFKNWFHFKLGRKGSVSNGNTNNFFR